MRGKTFALGLLLLMFAGCAAGTRRTPSLVAAPAPPTSPPPPANSLWKDMGDATWRVVSAPVNLIVPPKKTKAPPQVYEPPTAQIIIPSSQPAPLIYSDRP